MFLDATSIFALIILGAVSMLVVRWRYGRKSGPPGPQGLPIIGNLHMLGTLPHRRLRDLARKYGPIMSMRFGLVPTIIVSSPDAAKIFLKAHDTVFAGRPALEFADYFSYGRKGMALTSYGPQWRDFRKICATSLLSPAKIESFAGLRRKEVAAFVEAIKGAAAAREVVDVTKKVAELVENMTCRMVMGRSRDDGFELKKIIEEMMYLVAAFNIGDYVPFLRPFDLQGVSRRIKSTSKVVDNLLEALLDDHLQESHIRAIENQPGDFVDGMLEIINKSSTNESATTVTMMDRESIKAIVTEMLAGAIDTSTTAVEWAISELIRHPRVMKKLQDEIRGVIGRERMVDESDIPKFEYLNLVVKEALRLHPVAPLMLPHECMEDISVAGFHIPKKTQVIVNAWAIGHDPKAWSENVEEFLPERFVGSSVDLQGMDFQLLPFGSGRRRCPGMRLALTLVRLMVAQLVHCFDWELPGGMSVKDLEMSEKFGLTVLRAHHLKALPTYRLLG